MLLNFLMQPFFLFDPDPDTGGGATDDDDSNDNNANTGGNGGNDDGDEQRFTQADLDRAAGERAKRAKKAAVNDLLADLGLSSTSELKTLISSHREAVENKKTELQKAQEAAQRAATEKADLEARYQRERIDRVIEREARGMDFAETAIADVTLLVDRTEIEESEGGQISGVKSALEALLEAKPHLRKQAQRGDPAPDLDGKQGKGGTKSKPDRSAVRRRFGI